MADIEAALPPPPPQQAPPKPPRWASAAAALRGVPNVLVYSYVTAMWGGARGGGGGGGAKAHLSRRDSSGGARGRQDGGFVGRVVVLFMVFACCVAFVCVMLRDFAPEKGSCQEWVGSILAYIGVFAGSAMMA
ncbi:hypothetical protein OsJ_27329 [Oryza sativa Japonica Group]|uniref:Uncharacterized protein n=1 Tax=Oryza sativa subsp. japonica TaxID=39947 RepID=A3BT61_ORYSJ|nr:hypothetical protein OsJ_27329 [Oryza sativa Japonica Group]